MASAPTVTGTSTSTPPRLPRITIQFCTQCKWMLRAAYFAQELLSTFSTSLGEVALQPSTGGTFIVELYTAANVDAEDMSADVGILKHVLWDRKSEGGFPEIKELKKRVRNIIDPTRDLGHVDGKKSSTSTSAPAPATTHATATSYPQAPSVDHSLEAAHTSSSSTTLHPEPQTHSAAPQAATPMTNSSGSSTEKLNSRGKIVVGAGEGGLEGEGGFGFCKPGDMDCGGL